MSIYACTSSFKNHANYLIFKCVLAKAPKKLFLKNLRGPLLLTWEQSRIVVLFF